MELTEHPHAAGGPLLEGGNKLTPKNKALLPQMVKNSEYHWGSNKYWFEISVLCMSDQIRCLSENSWMCQSVK